MKIGILGAGQLGRMLAEAGAGLGMEFRFLDPAEEISARGLGEHIRAAYDDPAALERFADGLDLVTYEFENVPQSAVRPLAEKLTVLPPPAALRVAQDRLYEKNHARDLAVPIGRFQEFFFEDELIAAFEAVGLPAVMKTRRFGYDGKGQRVIRTAEEGLEAYEELRGVPLILEEFVPFHRELSLIAVRAQDRTFGAWPLAENHHREGILRLSIAPAPDVSADMQTRAERHAHRIMNILGYVGTLAIEFFVRGNELYFNEMAPRVHNSGHWTIEGADTSQFENHLRAISGMPLGRPTPRGVSVMVNLIGNVPDAGAITRIDNAYLHDYGKTPRAGRKVGHITIVADDLASLLPRLDEVARVVQDEHLDAVLESRFGRSADEAPVG